MTFKEQPSTPNGTFVIDEERNLKARLTIDFNQVSKPQIAKMMELTSNEWELVTPIVGRYHDMKFEVVQVAEDEWEPRTILGPEAKVELEFGSLIGIVSLKGPDGLYLDPGDETDLPKDIGLIISEAAQALWGTKHFSMNSGWNAK